MTSLPDRRRRTATWIVIGVVALAMVSTVLAINLLSNLPTGTGPTATESLVASATSGPSDMPLASSSASSTPIGQTGAAWAATGSMLEARSGAWATLLPNGNVLVAGGQGSLGPLASAELYHPSTGSWTGAGAMIEARYGYTATTLPDGSVLIAGGTSTIAGSLPVPLAAADLYDPRHGTWTATGSMVSARVGHTATLLPDGTVLVAGGLAQSDVAPTSPLASAETYDPGTGVWTTAPGMIEGRYDHMAALLPGGRVLVAGGIDPNGASLDSAELYDPANRTWTGTGNMTEARNQCTATLLLDGRLLVVGGISYDHEPHPLMSAEVYDAISGSWTPTGAMTEGRFGHTATLLFNGKVLVAGAGGMPASAELYDPGTGVWTTTAGMIAGHQDHIAALLPGGRVLVAGGIDPNGGALVSAELYDPGSGS